MAHKINQARPEGITQPEIRPGDKWRDKTGTFVSVTGYPQWETVGIELLDRCVTKDGLTDVGREIWQSMINDMGATVAGGNHA
ncbi:hypothetical protein E7703_00575 [Citrobacter portucalensis]|uniref:hypothetical protein n=1 Tax=Enterobacteriaceae TaxID=543 RepID=UPI0010A42B14|nr:MULTISPECIES: hypothetical protein [Enterobacteriaceae]EHS3156717.1 hypothetical protein [Escherichia coli]MEB7190824.1 hypothetical protein [Escherichia coli]QCC99783.1 hypothetical protein E7703_00575 [Citrobacter portucalensis]HCG2934680.1 hypothetical protein [Escherichia coli]HCP8032556.1 hypothetical protein [Escherichia coli]